MNPASSSDTRYVLVVYHSGQGSVRDMAHAVASGVSDTMEARVRAVAPWPEAQAPTPEDPIATLEELSACSGLILGTPSFYGMMASPLKHFLETTTSLWFKGALVNKPAGGFCASASHHGGNEATLLSMMVPLMHQGMVWCGVPYTQPELNTTTRGGTPYGPSHISGLHHQNPLNDEEHALCRALGARVARVAQVMVPLHHT